MDRGSSISPPKDLPLVLAFADGLELIGCLRQPDGFALPGVAGTPRRKVYKME
jgi:hypothetical protein